MLAAVATRVQTALARCWFATPAAATFRSSSVLRVGPFAGLTTKNNYEEYQGILVGIKETQCLGLTKEHVVADRQLIMMKTRRHRSPRSQRL